MQLIFITETRGRRCWVSAKIWQARICTFHITLTLEHDERIPSASALFVTDDSYPFNAAVTLELPTEVAVGGVFVLVKMSKSYEVRRRIHVRDER